MVFAPIDLPSTLTSDTWYFGLAVMVNVWSSPPSTFTVPFGAIEVLASAEATIFFFRRFISRKIMKTIMMAIVAAIAAQSITLRANAPATGNALSVGVGVAVLTGVGVGEGEAVGA